MDPLPTDTLHWEKSMNDALTLAESMRGRTAPNPPVAAVLLDAQGEPIAQGVHQGAGHPHAEIEALMDAQRRGVLSRAHTLLVTLEPCAHFGRTPPCSAAIAESRIPRVVYAVRDQNPRVAGGGAQALSEAGVHVVGLESLWSRSHPVVKRALELVRPFFHWAKTGRPWVTLKVARRPDGSMIPPQGQRTFTSKPSLTFAHELRRRSDAILTGSGTILADHPQFTVRHVPDHPGKSRKLVILDRSGLVAGQAASYLEAARARGFSVQIADDLSAVLDSLGAEGVLEVLVEAGPRLLESVESARLWNERVVISQSSPGQEEVYTDVYGDH